MSTFSGPLVLLSAISLVVLSINAHEIPPNLQSTTNPPIFINDWDISGSVKSVSGLKERDTSTVVPKKNSTIWLDYNTIIKKKVQVQGGKLYGLTFSATKACNQNVTVNISVSSNSIVYDSGSFTIERIYNNDGWASYSWDFVARIAVTEITMQSSMIWDMEGTFCGPIIDAVFYYLASPAGNMVKNGNFEQGPYILANTAWGVLIPPSINVNNSPLPGWTIESYKAARYIDLQHFSVPEGKRAIELVGGDKSVIVQVVVTVPRRNYYLSFKLGDANNNCVGDLTVETNVGILTDLSWYESKGKGGFKTVKLLFQAVATQTRVSFMSVNIAMKNDMSGSVCGPVIDDVAMVAA